MVQLALNRVYVKDGWTWYRNGPEDELSVCDLIRRAAEALEVELPILSDDDLSDLLTDWLSYGADEPEGVLAILYRALWAMAEVREQLCRYEDAGLTPEEIMALKEPPNDPLTLEELREMDGDPVWVQPAKPGGKIPARWMLLECTSKDKDLYLFTPPSGIAQGYKGADYGKTWLAYRRKPEEGTA